jgi:hypothetical protein
MWQCSNCDEVFHTVDHLIPVFDSVAYGRQMYFTANRKLIHDLYELSDEEAANLEKELALAERAKTVPALDLAALMQEA